MHAIELVRISGWNVEADPYSGPYVAELGGWRAEMDPRADGARIRFAIEPKDMLPLADALIRQHSYIERRRLTDAICGDCALCRNTRMTTKALAGTAEGRYDGDDAIHCPTCEPKLDAARRDGMLDR